MDTSQKGEGGLKKTKKKLKKNSSLQKAMHDLVGCFSCG